MGGQEARANSWPWIVNLQFQNDEQIASSVGSGGIYYSGCGGTIINKNWILTAAHCCALHERVRVHLIFGQHDRGEYDSGEFRLVFRGHSYWSVAKVH